MSSSNDKCILHRTLLCLCLVFLNEKQVCDSFFFEVLFFNLFTIFSQKVLLFLPGSCLYGSHGALFLLKCRPHTCAVSFSLAGCCLSLTTVARTQASFPPISNCLFCVIKLCIQTGSLAIYIVLQRQQLDMVDIPVLMWSL